MFLRLTLLFSLACTLCTGQVSAAEISSWTPTPADWKGATVADGKATLSAEKWSFLRSPTEHSHAELTATVVLAEPAKQFRFFGEGWSAWPDPTFGDGGFEAA